jgi:hypothetical protein
METIFSKKYEPNSSNFVYTNFMLREVKVCTKMVKVPGHAMKAYGGVEV